MADQKLARTAYRVRRVMGWGTVFISAVTVGMGVFFIWRILNEDLHPLLLLEPAMFFIFGIAILRFARKFFDPRQCGLPEDYR